MYNHVVCIILQHLHRYISIKNVEYMWCLHIFTHMYITCSHVHVVCKFFPVCRYICTENVNVVSAVVPELS